MLKKLTNIALLSSALMLAGIGAAAAHSKKAEINSISFDAESLYLSNLYVESTDGAAWNKLADGNLTFWAKKMEIDTKYPGWVVRAGIVLGKCVPSFCGKFPLLWDSLPQTRDFTGSAHVSFPVSYISQGETAGLGLIR